MKQVGWMLAAVGVALLAVGLVLGLGAVHRDGVACGSGLKGVSDAATIADYSAAYGADLGINPGYDPARSVADDCKSAVSDRATFAWALIVPGGLLLVGALMMAGQQAWKEPVAV